jgi:hypothetical protein
MGKHEWYPCVMSCADKQLIRFETVKGVHLEVDPFPEHILTPTLKVKR